jgi:hypothetical protein
MKPTGIIGTTTYAQHYTVDHYNRTRVAAMRSECVNHYTRHKGSETALNGHILRRYMYIHACNALLYLLQDCARHFGKKGVDLDSREEIINT